MSADRLAEIRARWESLRGGISGDGTRHWYWCCRAEYEVGAEDNRHHEDCFLFGHESMDDDVGWLCAEVERQAKLLTAAKHALRSYQYHNSSPDLAEAVADAIVVREFAP